MICCLYKSNLDGLKCKMMNNDQKALKITTNINK